MRRVPKPFSHFLMKTWFSNIISSPNKPMTNDAEKEEQQVMTNAIEDTTPLRADEAVTTAAAADDDSGDDEIEIESSVTENNGSAEFLKNEVVSENGYDGDDSLDGESGTDEVDDFEDIAFAEPNDGTDDGDYDDIEEPPQPESIRELVESLRTLTDGDDLSALDPPVKKRIRDFRYAQNQRRKKYHFRPFGIVGLFSNLSDIRSDLRWAEDVAIRKRHGKKKLSWKKFEKRRTSGFNRPYFTYVLALVNIAMMVVAFQQNNWRIEPLNVNPLFGPDPFVLVDLGALQTREMIETGTWYRLVSAMFLHGGIMHIIINVGVIVLIGRVIERNHGVVRTAVLFFIPALGGNIISGVMQPAYILVGASGGIFGLIGVCVADIVLNWKLLFIVFKQYRGRSGCWMRFLCAFWLAFDLFINTIIGFTPFVDNFAHLGGLLYGFMLALTILHRLPLSFFGNPSGCCHLLKIYSLRCLGAAIVCFMIVASALLLSRSDGLKSPCLKCRYISCAPFPFWTENKWWYCDGCDASSGDIFRRRGNVYFSDLELLCPDGEIAFIDIFDERLTDPFDVQIQLAGYCREHC